MTWTKHDRTWAGLSSWQKAAAMALMEADGANPNHARNALGAMVNRSKHYGEDIGAHVSRRIYQPTIEPAQQQRLSSILRNPAFGDLTGWAERRWNGQEADPVGGATHFLAHPNVMMKLSGGVRPDGKGSYVGNSSKYYSWPRWTGYNPNTNQYRGQVHSDGSHAFLIPKGYGNPGQSQQPAAQQAPAPLAPHPPPRPTKWVGVQTPGAGWDGIQERGLYEQPTPGAGWDGIAPDVTVESNPQATHYATEQAAYDSAMSGRGSMAAGRQTERTLASGPDQRMSPTAATPQRPQQPTGPQWVNEAYGQGIRWGDGARTYMGEGGSFAPVTFEKAISGGSQPANETPSWMGKRGLMGLFGGS